MDHSIFHNYYTDGSFYPPKEIAPNVWHVETTSYGIYNAHKDLRISKRFLRLQNILRA